MQQSDFRFSCPLRVRWAEADPQGIVFNGHYLTYADVGITEYFRALRGASTGAVSAQADPDTAAVTARARVSVRGIASVPEAE